jgi:hypothetical protein
MQLRASKGALGFGTHWCPPGQPPAAEASAATPQSRTAVPTDASDTVFDDVGGQLPPWAVGPVVTENSLPHGLAEGTHAPLAAMLSVPHEAPGQLPLKNCIVTPLQPTPLADPQVHVQAAAGARASAIPS